MSWPLFIMWVILVIMGVFVFYLSQEISKVYSILASVWRKLDEQASKITALESDKANKTNKAKEKK